MKRTNDVPINFYVSEEDAEKIKKVGATRFFREAMQLKFEKDELEERKFEEMKEKIKELEEKLNKKEEEIT